MCMIGVGLIGFYPVCTLKSSENRRASYSNACISKGGSLGYFRFASKSVHLICPGRLYVKISPLTLSCFECVFTVDVVFLLFPCSSIK